LQGRDLWQGRAVSTPGYWTHSGRSQTVLEEVPDARREMAARATAAGPDGLDSGAWAPSEEEEPDAGTDGGAWITLLDCPSNV